MKKHRRARISALLLALVLLLTPAAQALTLEQARELIATHYVDQVPDAALSQPTIADMLDTLGDPYTQYFTPQEYLEFQGGMEDTETVGIGLSYFLTEQGLLVSGVFAGAPAEAAGLAAGDLLVAAQGTSLVGLNETATRALLSGAAGTTLTLDYLRGDTRHTVTLTRQPYTILLTSARLVDGHIGYISCSAFGAETYGHFQDAITTYGGEATYWVVDLRSNGGGTIDAALQTVSAFAEMEVITYLQDNSGTPSGYYAPEKPLTDRPVIILSDDYTASASELFSSALRDENAGVVVGGRTYGKGVAQQVFDQSVNPDYFPDGSALKITTSRYYSPAGTSVDTVGIIPHFLVDADLAPDVARLLSPTAPTGDNSRYLRIDKGWYWYVNLDEALSPELRAAFVALLESLPSNTPVLEGTGAAQGWAETTAAAVAARCQLSEYEPRVFSDSTTSPYGQYLDILATYGILSGTGDGSFDPGGTLTRAQLCALLAQALNCKPYTGSSRFSDVAEGAWYYSSVNAMAKLGLVSGSGGRFRPDDPVDHQELVTIMARLSRRLNLFFDLAAKDMPTGATAGADFASYADWARPGLWLLADSQEGFFGNTFSLLWENTASISPTDTTTREEAATLLYNILSYTGILPA